MTMVMMVTMMVMVAMIVTMVTMMALVTLMMEMMATTVRFERWLVLKCLVGRAMELQQVEISTTILIMIIRLEREIYFQIIL